MFKSILLISYFSLVHVSEQSNPLFRPGEPKQSNAIDHEESFEKKYLYPRSGNYVKMDVLKEVCEQALMKSYTFGQYCSTARGHRARMLDGYPLESEATADLLYCNVYCTFKESKMSAFPTGQLLRQDGDYREFMVSRGWFIFGNLTQNYETKWESVKVIENLNIKAMFKRDQHKLENEFRSLNLYDGSSSHLTWNVLEDICSSALAKSYVFLQSCGCKGENHQSLHSKVLERYPIELRQYTEKSAEADLLFCKVQCGSSSKTVVFLLSKGWYLFMNSKEDYEHLQNPVHIVEQL